MGSCMWVGQIISEEGFMCMKKEVFRLQKTDDHYNLSTTKRASLKKKQSKEKNTSKQVLVENS